MVGPIYPGQPADAMLPCCQYGQEQIRVAHVGCLTEKAKGQSQPGGRTSTNPSVEVVKGIGPEDFHPRVGMSRVQNLASMLPCHCQALLEVGQIGKLRATQLDCSWRRPSLMGDAGGVQVVQ
jgi:hypothetical protein